MNIGIIDYMIRSPKGRAAGKRVTVYAVGADTREAAAEAAYAAHEENIRTGAVEAPYTTAGYALKSGATPDFTI